MRFEYLDLGCLPAADARKGAIRAILTAPDVAIRVHELCVQAPVVRGLDMAAFRAGLRTLTNPHARTLDDAAAGVPSFVAVALRPIAARLVERGISTIVLTNGAERHDEWLLELARMYGVAQVRDLKFYRYSTFRANPSHYCYALRSPLHRHAVSPTYI